MKNRLLKILYGMVDLQCHLGRVSLIISYLGSSNGFLQNCGECLVGSKDSAGCHHEMNDPHFEDWFISKVLPSLEDKSVVVIDNARYHSRLTEDSKRPATNWRKAAIQQWLTEKGVTFDKKDTIPILLQKREMVPIIKKYVLEEETKKYCLESGKHIEILIWLK